MRVGHGYDAHRLAEGRALILGGEHVPYERGLAAHSDGDVLVHALCDALFGAAGLGDLGRHFPDTDATWKGIDSRILLRNAVRQVRQLGLAVSNADVTVIAQAPRLKPYVEAMRANLAADLEIGVARVNVKATTTEGMGFPGRGEGIAAHAVVLLDE